MAKWNEKFKESEEENNSKREKYNYQNPVLYYPFFFDETIDQLKPETLSGIEKCKEKIEKRFNKKIKGSIVEFSCEKFKQIKNELLIYAQEITKNTENSIKNEKDLKSRIREGEMIIMELIDQIKPRNIQAMYTDNTLSYKFHELAEDLLNFEYYQDVFLLDWGNNAVTISELIKIYKSEYNEYLDDDKFDKFEFLLFLILKLRNIIDDNNDTWIAYSIWSLIEFKFSNQFFFKDLIKKIKSSMIQSLKEFESITFLEAVRANTQRIYAYHSQGTGFNELLAEFESKEFKKDDDEFKFIRKWVQEFGIGVNLKVKQNHEGVGNQLQIDGKNLADIGYGFTQFLPILLKIGIVARKNRFYDLDLDDETNNILFDGYRYDKSTLIIEEPETNLHPKLQSLLADMFIDAENRFHIQFIIETHSEYLIRKLQYLTANKEHEYTINPEDTVIYYFNDPKDLTSNECLSIKSDIFIFFF